jgi:hypothetical protein
MLATYTPLKALVGNRIYWQQALQNAEYPHIVLKDIANSLTPTLDSTRGPSARRVSIECRAPTYLVAENIGELVLQRLEPFRGTYESLLFTAIIPVSDVALFEDTSGVHSRAIDFRVHYS